MRAIRIHSFGGPDVLRVETLPDPQPGPDEMLVKILAASVNPVDYKIRNGGYPAVKDDKLPYTLGRDVAGVVERCGDRISRFKRGDAIYAMLGIDRGGFSEYAIVKDGEAAPKPARLDFIAAAAVPLAGLTAWQGLFRHGGLEAGQAVLIHAGAGGVGHLAIQFAKARGAHVVTTVSEQHADFVRRIGADEVIDYKRQRFEELVHDVDMVLDLIGGETQERSFQVLREGGILVSTLAAPSQHEARAHKVRATRFTVQESGTELAEIGRLIAAGKVTPKVARQFNLGDAVAAETLVEEGHTEGKVVLRVAA
ncbi:MAG TPA: NADP-dependent oxidoreductase [Xanthobacteraceae bacterium]|nr:NADP-dependent oxidoreductase [Xanthobacteraceae bacterium]